MLQLAVALLAGAHLPVFKPGKTTVVKNPDKSQVFYSRGGTQWFEWKCGRRKTIFWEIYAPNAARPGVSVELYGLDDAVDAKAYVTGSYTERPGAPADGPFLVDVTPCPFRTYYEGFSAVAYRALLRYGSAPCLQEGTTTLKITSTGPYAFSIGEEERFGALEYMSMTYYYIAAGSWAGFPCPGTHLIIAIVFIVGANLVAMYAGKQPMDGPFIVIVETILVAAWVIAFLVDIQRFGAMQKIHPCEPTSDLAEGPEKHSDGSKNAGRGAAGGILAARLVLSASAIALIFFAARWTKVPWLAGVVVGAFILATGSVILGVGYGFAPVSLLVWAVYNLVVEIVKAAPKKKGYSQLLVVLFPPRRGQATKAAGRF